MFGPDVEDWIMTLQNVRDAAEKTISELSIKVAYQLTHKGPHDAVIIPWQPPCYPVEEGHKIGSMLPKYLQQPMIVFNKKLIPLNVIRDQMYQSPANITNSLGSPWKELNHISDLYNELSTYEGTYTPYAFLGEKVGLVLLMNEFYTAVCEAKWPVIYYHDWLQRGYDPSGQTVSWNDDLNGTKTTGKNVQKSSGVSNPY